MTTLKEHLADFRQAMKTIGGYLLVVLILGGLAQAVSQVHGYFWGEHEGFAKSDDCRITIPTKQGSSDTWFKSFICTYSRSASGKILGGSCIHVETDGLACKTAYTYERQSDIHCRNPKFPYPGYDDKCHTDPQ